MQIWGAGISGLIAANVFQTAKVFEASPREKMVGHKALLRFRSTAVADAVGIDFRKVRVHKGLWCDNQFVSPSILHANNYSVKVVGRLADRSIWNLDACDRYIAPEDFVDQLAERCGSRITWGVQINADHGFQGPIISTIPMRTLAEILNCKGPEFGFAQIAVQRWRIPGADVYQSIYVSQPDTNCYRVSITGDLLIAEFIGDPDGFDIFRPFGVSPLNATLLETSKQRFGKITPINDAWRKQFMLDASNRYNIFSLGRFGTWRNILLDDVVHDIAVIKRLMSASPYERSRHNAK